MSRDWKKNTVHQAAYHQARGISPVLPFEGFVATIAGLAALAYAGPLTATCVALAALSGLFAWRMAEHDRADYGLAFVRRMQRGRRCYNALEKEHNKARLLPFKPAPRWR